MNRRYLEMQTAKAWHRTPSEWDALDPDDQAEMMAFEEVTGIIEAINVQEQTAEIKRKK